MFNNIFCEMNIKKVIHCGMACGNWGTVLICSWKCNFNIYFDIQVYYLDIKAITTLLCLLLVLYVLVPSIHSFFYLTTALWKSNIFWHSKAYSSYSFQPTGIMKRKQVCIQESLVWPLNWFIFIFIFKVVYFSCLNILFSNK